MMMHRSLLFAASLAAALPFAALAQTMPSPNPPLSSDPTANTPVTPAGQASAVSPADREFVNQAAMGGLAEIALSREALENSQSDPVKTFAQRMIADHTKAGNQLAGVASEQGIPVPTAPDAKHRKLAQRLAKLTGPAFDKAYSQAMVEDHDKTLALLNREIKSGQDQAIVAWAKQTLPVIEEHDHMAHLLPEGPPVSQ